MARTAHRTNVRRHRNGIALRAVAGVVVLGWLAGCSGGSAGSTESADVEMRSVTDVEGTTMEVPVEPQRVVTLSEPTLDGALALAVEPVATVAGRGQSGAPGYLGDRAEGITVIGTIAEPDYEAIASADPDLILVDGTAVNNAEVMEVLRAIAPTYFAGYAGGDWRATFAQVAEALNLAEEAEEVEEAYDAQVEQARSAIGDRSDETFSIVRWQGGSPALILKELPAGMALEDLHLTRPASQDRRGRGHSEPVSLENISTIDADHLFFGTLGGASQSNPAAGGSSTVDGAEKALEAAMKVPGFDQLQAVANSQVHLVDGSLWTSTGGPLLMSGIVEDVVEVLR